MSPQKAFNYGRLLQKALDNHFSTLVEESHLRSPQAMEVGIRYNVYPRTAQWNFNQENWDNGTPVRNLVYRLEKLGMLKSVLPSAKFIPSVNNEFNEYHF